MPQGIIGLRSKYGPGIGAMAVALGFFFLIAPATAHAYIDPGSGALIWQGLVAAGVGALFYLRRFFQALRGKRSSAKLTDEPGEGSSETPR